MLISFFPTDQKLQPSQVQLFKYTEGPAANEESSSEFENSILSPEKPDKQLERTRLSCIYCNSKQTYLYKKSLYKHFKKCHPNRTVKCHYNKKCARLFKTKEDLEIHVKAFHENDDGRKRRVCIYCDKLIYFDHFNRHMRNHHKDVAIKCDFIKTCPNYFKSQFEKKKHIREEHLNVKLQEVNCIYCKKSFLSNNNLRVHISKRHTKLKIKCTVSGCATYFLSQSDREAHFDEKHQAKDISKSLQCALCPYRAMRKDHLTSHISRMHQSQQLNCSKCSKTFKSSLSLKYHLTNVHGERKKCVHCKKSVMKLSAHLQNNICECCQKPMSCFGLLVKHKKECRSLTKIYIRNKNKK
jgi:hypothetical protein